LRFRCFDESTEVRRLEPVTDRETSSLKYKQLPKKEAPVSILWIVLIVVLVLALLGFVGRGF